MFSRILMLTTAALTVFTATSAYTANINSFQNKKFGVFNSNYCGIHTEVTSSRFLIIDHIPNPTYPRSTCWTTPRNKIAIFKCSADTCVRMKDFTNHSEIDESIRLLDDGNFILFRNGRSGVFKYYRY